MSNKNFAFAAEMKEAAEAGEPERRRIRFIASTDTVDRSGDIVVQQGIELAAFRQNPVVLWNHDRQAPIARASQIALEDGRLVATADFPPAGISPDSDRVYGLIKAGILNSVSIGARPLESEPLDRAKPWGGRRYLKSELHELSIVSVPANPQSQIVARQYTPAPSGGPMDALQQLKKSRDMKFSDFQTLGSMCETRKLDEAELQKMQELESSIGDLDGQIEQLERIEQSKIAMAKPVPRQAPALIPMNRGVSIPDRRELTKGEGFGFMTAALALTRMNGPAAAEILEKQYGLFDLAKALATSPLAAGGALVPIKYANEIIELLRSQAVILRAGPRMIDLEGFGSLRIPVQATGTTANYIGENIDIPYSEATFSELLLTPKKLAVNTASSNELIRRSLPAAATVMRDDAVGALREKMDAQLLLGAGSSTAPKGLEAWIASGNKFAATAGATLAGVTGDLLHAQGLVRVAKILAQRPAYFLSPGNEFVLMAMRDGTGNKAFPEMAQGQILGIPYYSTTAMPDDKVLYADMANAILVTELSLAVDVSTEAAYLDGASALVSAWSRDQTVMRVISTHDFALRYATAGAEITAVDWVA